MDKKLQIVERLYGEDATSGPSDTREERVLTEAKFVMDHRPTQRPSAETIDRIVAYAAEQQTKRRAGPAARILPLLPWRAAVAAVFVFFVIGIAYLQFGTGPAEEPRAEAGTRQAADAPGAEALQPASLAVATDSVPAWDEPTDLRLFQRRIETLRASGQDLEWGETVPLEQLPVTATTPGLRTAGAGDQQ